MNKSEQLPPELVLALRAVLAAFPIELPTMVGREHPVRRAVRDIVEDYPGWTTWYMGNAVLLGKVRSDRRWLVTPDLVREIDKMPGMPVLA